jgi:hypothetical protein
VADRSSQDRAPCRCAWSRDLRNWNGLRDSGARTIIWAMMITEWVLVLTASALLFVVAALLLRPGKDHKALLRDVIVVVPPRTRVRD